MIISTTQPKRIGAVLAGNMMVTIILIMCTGLYMVYDATGPKASYNGGVSFQFMKQLTWNFLGLICFYSIVQTLNIELLKKAAPWIGALVIILLAGVLVIGHEIKGASRWYRLGPISFQPSEMAKIFSVVFFAWYLDRHKEDMNKWYGMLPCMLLILTTVGLIALEPDLGNAVLLFAVLVSMLYIAGARLVHLISLLAITLPGFIYIMLTKFDHIMKRLEVFINPEDHLSGGAYQGHQALIALGSGGGMGKGVGAGLQKLYFLPEAHNDFIFAIIGEDFGFMGCALTVLLYMILVFYSIQACTRCTQLFSLLMAYGITFVFAGQALFNISVVTGVVPNKGISLPLISYGGSNALLTLIGLGILVRLTKNLPPEVPLGLGAIRHRKVKRLF
jgi:cell division protein FtsW